MLGRRGLQELPRNRLLENIKPRAKRLLELNEYWEYTRLLEVYWLLDKGLVQDLVDWGFNNVNEEIKKIAMDTGILLKFQPFTLIREE